MVAKDFYVGNTHIIIDDEYCVKAEEEVERILQRIAYKAYESLIAEEHKKRNYGSRSGRLIKNKKPFQNEMNM